MQQKFARHKKVTKIPTPERLRNIALFYLSRFAASEKSLRRVLENRLRRASLAHPEFAQDYVAQKKLREEIEAIIQTHKRTGAVNDESFAAMKVAGLRRAGKSQRAITQKLTRDLHDATLQQAISTHDAEQGDEGDAEWQAALRLAKKKKLGPFADPCRQPPPRSEEAYAKQRKDMAVLARAGFGMDIIRKILNLAAEDIPEGSD